VTLGTEEKGEGEERKRKKKGGSGNLASPPILLTARVGPGARRLERKREKKRVLLLPIPSPIHLSSTLRRKKIKQTKEKVRK